LPAEEVRLSRGKTREELEADTQNSVVVPMRMSRE
jgi:hypothetical protein